ncbi:hypothetical protein [Streptomyces sp. NPDC046727]|uniref:hypothetical protein n=1 Tax=Streptomyces sp. NPDC046727 TaxID=3155373 RepID=UPI0033C848A3
MRIRTAVAAVVLAAVTAVAGAAATAVADDDFKIGVSSGDKCIGTGELVPVGSVCE